MSLIDKLGLTSKKKKEEEIKRNRKQRRGDEKMNQRGEQIMKKAVAKITHNMKRDNNLKKIEARHEKNRQASAKRREAKKQENIRKHNERMAQHKHHEA